jgi:hypothetical protein
MVLVVASVEHTLPALSPFANYAGASDRFRDFSVPPFGGANDYGEGQG